MVLWIGSVWSVDDLPKSDGSRHVELVSQMVSIAEREAKRSSQSTLQFYLSGAASLLGVPIQVVIYSKFTAPPLFFESFGNLTL